MGELLPCPFCGCEASVYSADSDGPHWIQCDMCGVRGADAKWAENAQAWWNTRARSGDHQLPRACADCGQTHDPDIRCPNFHAGMHPPISRVDEYPTEEME